MSHGTFADWQARGLVHQATATGIEEGLDGEGLIGYIGFDPTAASLHVGNLLPITLLTRLQRAGHRPIALVGGGTGMIGDPSGKDEERVLLTEERLLENAIGLRRQLERFLDFSPAGGALLVDNAEWLSKLDLVGFLRDVGKHFSVNTMIARDSVKRRLDEREHGISYTEFSYSLLQAYDYLELYDRYGCTLQLGGSDQWGNIVAGADLVRRQRGVEVHGLTSPLLTRSDGSKFGKSEKGNVWLDAELTTPFEFYQFWLNSADEDVPRLLRFFTFLERTEIEALEASMDERPGEREAQRRLADDLTGRVHGETALARARKTTQILFGGGDLHELEAEAVRDAFGASPTTPIPRRELEGGLPLVEALARTGLGQSKGRARKDIESGAISVNHQTEADPHRNLGLGDAVAGAYIVLRRGKKTYHLIEVVAG
jgi:tyrosyl-tRNA synthetase